MNYKLLPALLLICFISVSCKKKKNDNPFANSKLATVTVSHTGSVLVYNVVYDQFNNVDSMSITGSGTSAGYSGSRKFRYFGTSFSITDESGSVLTVYGNSNGQILELPFTSDTITFKYNGNQLSEKDELMPSLAPPYYTITRTNYGWANGDLRSEATGLTQYNYDYNTAKSGQPGDAWRIRQFLNYGRSYVKTTHLPVDKMEGNTTLETYLYITDGSGRVNQLTIVGSGMGAASNDTTVYSYTYYQ